MSISSRFKSQTQSATILSRIVNFEVCKLTKLTLTLYTSQEKRIACILNTFAVIGLIIPVYTIVNLHRAPCRNDDDYNDVDEHDDDNDNDNDDVA